MKITEKITITNEDNMELMARYPDGYFDIAIVDPPYFSGPEKRKYYGNAVNKLNIKRVDYSPLENSWELPTAEYFSELFRVSKQQIIWGCNYYAEFIPNVGRIVWDKVNGESSFSDAEIASSSFHNSVRLFRFMWNGMMQGCDFEGNMQGDKKLNEKRIHPTQKPVALYKWLLDKYAKTGNKILDTHLGSGSIAIACHDYGYELTACELDEKYYSSALKQIKCHIAFNQSLFQPEELTQTLF
ncbi:site-specific DNA-methyltransferase [Elizabethkingia anophelis]|nr:site-specific DNA-methyltransferase [Elizabethkingia anophelis]